MLSPGRISADWAASPMSSGFPDKSLEACILPQAYIGRACAPVPHCSVQRTLPESPPARVPVVPTMDITIQHPWFKRALGPFYPSRLFDQFFGEGLFEHDLLPFLWSTISPRYFQSLFRTMLDAGISEVRPAAQGQGRAWLEGQPGFWGPDQSTAAASVPSSRPVSQGGRRQPPSPHPKSSRLHVQRPPVPLGRGWEREST